MKCPNCQNPLKEGQAFCGVCGKAAPAEETFEANTLSEVNEATEAVDNFCENTVDNMGFPSFEDAMPMDVPETAADENLTIFAGDEEPLSEASAPYEAPYAAEAPEAVSSPEGEVPSDNFNINFSTEETPAEEATEGKKKKFKWGKFLLITIPALLVSAAIIFNLGWIIGFAIKTFGTPEAYLKFCEKKGMYDTIDTIGPIYENTIDNLTTQATSSIEMKLEVSDTLITLLGPALPEEYKDIDLSFLKNIRIEGISTQDRFVAQNKLDLIVNDVNIVGLDMVTDLNNEKVYLGIPELTDKYAEGEAYATLPFTEDDLDAIVDIVKDIAPSKFQLGMLLSKYMGLVFEAGENAEKESDTLEIDGIKQKVTKLSFEVTEESSLEAAENLLEELKKDKAVKKFIEKFQKEYEDRIDDMDTDLYDDFSDLMDEGIDALGEETADDENVIYVTDYINFNHEIIGREIEVDGEVFYMAKVSDKDDYKVEIKYNDEVVLSGSGTETKDTITGDFEIYVDGYTFNISLEDFDRKALKKGYLCGTLSYAPSEEAMAELAKDDPTGGIISGSRPSLEISFDQSEGEFSSEIILKAMDQSLITLSVSATHDDFTAPVIPSEDKIVSDEEFSEHLNLLPLLNNLNKAGIPLMNIIASIQSQDSNS